MVAITSGANMNFDRLRFVADRAEVGEAREAVFAVTVPRGTWQSFRRFCRVIGQRSVTELTIAQPTRTPRTSSSRCRLRGAAMPAIMAALQAGLFGQRPDAHEVSGHIRLRAGVHRWRRRTAASLRVSWNAPAR